MGLESGAACNFWPNRIRKPPGARQLEMELFSGYGKYKNKKTIHGNCKKKIVYMGNTWSKMQET